MSLCDGELEKLSINDLEVVDKACLKFEDRWLAGQTPEINEFISGIPGSARTAALTELISLDLEYRQRHGRTRTVEQYHSLFPGHRETVESAFANFHQRETKNASETPADNFEEPFPFENLKLENEYQVERFHARGGLGEIYLARDNRLDRLVAIKVARDRDPQSRERLRLSREAEITSRLKHPGIVPVHAAGHDPDGPPCYVMQFIEGQTFREAIDDFHKSFEAGKANKFNSPVFRRLLQRLVSVCNTIAYAHDQGVIHRDVKPSNIMLGDFGETFLLDWGLAKDIGKVDFQPTQKSSEASTWPHGKPSELKDETVAATRQGQPIGTPEYASPEQVQGKINEQDARSDVYSLGATLYYLLTGRTAITMNELTDLSTAAAIRNIAPTTHNEPKAPADLNAICMKAINFETSDRFQTATEFADELERFLADEPIQTRPEKFPTRVRRWLKTNPRKAYSILSGVSVAILALTISLLLLTQKADELADSLSTQQKMNSELEAAKESAEEYAKRTENALRTLANRLDETWFASQKTFSEKERKLLQDMLAQYQDFARSSPNPYFTRTVEAEAFERVARIQMLLGQNPESIESFRKAAELLENLPDDATERVRYIKANAIYQLGALLCDSGNTKDGLPQLEAAYNLTQSLANDFPERADHLNRLAIIQSRQGNCYLQLNQHNLAYEHLISAKEITKRLVDKFPQNIHFQQTYASRVTYLAKAYLQFSEFDNALVEYQSAVEALENVKNQDWIFEGMWRGLEYCVACNGVASSLNLLDQTDESLAAWEKATVAAERLVETYPAFSNAWSNLAVPNFQSATIFRDQQDWTLAIGRAQLAVLAIDKAVELSPQQRNFFRFRTVIRKELGLMLLESGDAVAAAEACQQAAIAARESFALDPDFALGIHGNRLELARVLHHLGRVQIELNQDPAAKESFAEAIAVLESASDDRVASEPVQDLLEQIRADLAQVDNGFDNGL